MPVVPFRETAPRLGERVWLAPSAWVTGDVTVGDDVSFWFGTAVRGDVHWIRIGAGSNVQDGAVLHVSHGTHPLDIGERVVIGHAAVVHGCVLEDDVLVGIGATVLDGAVVEAGAQVAAGAVVPPGMRVPAGQLVMGMPARPKRALSEAEMSANREIHRRYISLKETYREQLGSGLRVPRAPFPIDPT